MVKCPFSKVVLERGCTPNVDQEDIQPYEPGKGEKVSLLKNWREIFKDSAPKKDPQQSMKLQQSMQKAKPGSRRGRPRKKQVDNETEGQDVDPGSEQGLEILELLEQPKSFTPPPTELPGAQKPTPDDRGRASRRPPAGSKLRGAVSAADIPAPGTESSNINDEDVIAAATAPMPVDWDASRSSLHKTGVLHSPSLTDDHGELAPPPRRKRKASSQLDSVHESDISTAAMAPEGKKPRAKRVATEKNNSLEAKANRSTESTRSTRRSARSRAT